MSPNPKEKIPRYYQREASENLIWAEKGWDECRTQLVRIGTGGGKTFVAADTMRQTLPGKVLFLSDANELVLQPRKVIREVTGVVTGVEKAKERASLAAGIVVASIQTLNKTKRLARFPADHFDYVYVDEIHRHTESKMEVCKHFKNASVCGLTATPWRSNLADLSQWFENIACDMPLISLSEEGFAPPQVTLKLPVEVDMTNIRRGFGPDGEDLNLEDIECAILPHYDAIARLIRENGEGYHGIAYLPLIRSSKAFAAALRSNGVSAYHVDGASPDRAELLEAFGRGEFSWLVNAGVMGVGVDIPRCDAFLNLCATRSMSTYQQRKGRSARVLPGVIDHLPEKEQAEERRALIAGSSKPHFLVFDILWLDDTLGIIRPEDEFGVCAADSRAFSERLAKERTPQDMAELARKIQEERELQLVAALERAAIKSTIATPMSPGEIGALLGDRLLTSYVPVQAWEGCLPTEAQIRCLRGKGIDPETIANKWQASRIIGLLTDRSRLGFATIKQVKLLKKINELRPEWNKFPPPEKMSIQEAGQLLRKEIPGASALTA